MHGDDDDAHESYGLLTTPSPLRHGGHSIQPFEEDEEEADRQRALRHAATLASRRSKHAAITSGGDGAMMMNSCCCRPLVICGQSQANRAPCYLNLFHIFIAVVIALSLWYIIPGTRLRISGAPATPLPIMYINLCPRQIGEDSILTNSHLEYVSSPNECVADARDQKHGEQRLMVHANMFAPEVGYVPSIILPAAPLIGRVHFELIHPNHGSILNISQSLHHPDGQTELITKSTSHYAGSILRVHHPLLTSNVQWQGHNESCDDPWQGCAYSINARMKEVIIARSRFHIRVLPFVFGGTPYRADAVATLFPQEPQPLHHQHNRKRSHSSNNDNNNNNNDEINSEDDADDDDEDNDKVDSSDGDDSDGSMDSNSQPQSPPPPKTMVDMIKKQIRQLTDIPLEPFDGNITLIVRRAHLKIDPAASSVPTSTPHSAPELFLTFHQFSLSATQSAGVAMILRGGIMLMIALALASAACWWQQKGKSD